MAECFPKTGCLAAFLTDSDLLDPLYKLSLPTWKATKVIIYTVQLL